MAITYETVQVDDTDNLSYSYGLDYPTRSSTPDDLPQFQFDSGSWIFYNSAFWLQTRNDGNTYRWVHGPTVSDYGRLGVMFSLKYPTTGTIYSGFRLDVNAGYTSGVGGADDGTMKFYIMNFTDGTWEAFGSTVTDAARTDWLEEVILDKDMTLDYVFDGRVYVLMYVNLWDSNSLVEGRIDVDYFAFEFRYDDTFVPDALDSYANTIKERARALTGFGVKELPDSTLTVLIDVAYDDLASTLGAIPALSDTSQLMALIYFTCYLSMVSVYGPGIKRYRQDKNTITFGDPYAKKQSSWFLEQYEDELRKSRLVITKSDYDLRNYRPDCYERLKGMPCTNSMPVLDDLTPCPNCSCTSTNCISSCTCSCHDSDLG